MAFVTPVTTSLRQSSLRSTPTHPRFHPPLSPRHPPLLCTSDPAPLRVDTSLLRSSDASAAREARVQLWREVEALKKRLTIAVNAERYVDAAQLRDEIASLSLADDYVRTESELRKAVQEERFGEAARLRDALKTLEPPPGMRVLRGEGEVEGGRLREMKGEEVESWSRTKTRGIVVMVESYYMAEQSVPEQNRFLFGYKVSIANEGEETCQLVSRHWRIDNGEGGESEVKGVGVVGRQPVLEPGEKFEYTSACPVTVALGEGQCVVGSMKGEYLFCKGDTGNVKFSVKVDPFYFKLPFRNYRPSGPSPPGYPWAKP